MPIISPWLSLEPYPRMNLAHYLESCSLSFSDRTAVLTLDGKSYTFGQIHEWSKKVARYLQDRGISRGDRVGLFSQNSPEYFVAFLAVLRAGAAVTTLNSMYKDREVRRQLEDSRAVALLAGKPLYPVAQAAVEHLPALRSLECVDELWEWASDTPAEPLPVEIDPLEDLAVLPYSSGTTGLPKGVMLTHMNLVANVRQALTLGYTTSYTVAIDFLPFYHIYGLTILLNCGLAIGEKQIVMPGFNPEHVLSAIQGHKVTDMFTVPPALLIMLNHPDFSTYDLSSLKFIYCGAAPLPGELGEQARRAFGCPTVEAYGLTETSPVINTAVCHMLRSGSVGPPVADTIEMIVDLDTDEELPPGQVGELLVKGPQVMKGYWNQPEANAETFTDDGWLRTGDIAYAEEDGYVHIVDRKKEMIKYKGHQIAPAELEALLLEHPALLDVAVIPRRQSDGSETPKAFVVLRPGMEAGPDEIMRFVEERVAPYKKIRDIEFVPSIPKSIAGKILRRELILRDREQQAGG